MSFVSVIKVPLYVFCLSVRQIQCFWNAKLAYQKYAHDTFKRVLYKYFFPHYFFHFTQLTFFCLRSLRTAYHAYLFIVNQFFFRRHNLHTSPHANPMTLRRALTIELTSPIMFLVCQHLRSSKTLLLTERLSFLKGYQNGSSINADPGGFRVKLYIFSDC